MKVSNVKAQNLLENRLEPLYSLYEAAGANGAYKADHMNYLWKQLLKNHPHDSICGCSRDEVHAHMEDNYARFNEMGGYLLNKISEDIAFHTEINNGEKDDNILALINTTQLPQNTMAEAELIFLASEEVKGFTITDKEGNNIDFAVKSRERRKLDVFTALNLPGVVDVEVFKICLYAGNISPYAVKGLIIKKTDRFNYTELDTDESRILDNGLLRVKISDSGIVDISSYITGVTAENAINIEESCDRGDSYIYFKSDDKVNYGTDYPVKVRLIENNRFIKRCSISYEMNIPEQYDFTNKKRCDNLIICPVKLILTLRKGSDVLEVEYNVQNTAKDHRIRLTVDTNIASDISIADIPFDIIYRSSDMQYPDTMSGVHPNTSVAAIVKNNKGVAVFTEGAHEYEHLKDIKSVLAFTLVRSTGVIHRNGDLSVSGGKQWEVPENQCLRNISGRVGICLFSDMPENLPAKSIAFRNAVMPVFVSCDSKKYVCGRHAVQGSNVTEFYSLPDNYNYIKIKDNAPLL